MKNTILKLTFISLFAISLVGFIFSSFYAVEVIGFNYFNRPLSDIVANVPFHYVTFIWPIFNLCAILALCLLYYKYNVQGDDNKRLNDTVIDLLAQLDKSEIILAPEQIEDIEIILREDIKDFHYTKCYLNILYTKIKKANETTKTVDLSKPITSNIRGWK